MPIGYTYITEIKVSRKTLFYAGKKTCSEFRPKYFGSGRVVRLIKKSGKASLSVRLHQWHETLEEMNDAERKLIARLRSDHGKHCVNINDGGDGFNKETSAQIERTPSIKQRRTAAIKKGWENPTSKKAAAERAKNALENPERKRSFFAGRDNPEVKRRVSELHKKRWNEDEVYRLSMTLGPKLPERRKAVSEGQKKAWRDPAIRTRRAAALAAVHADPEFLARRAEAVKVANKKPAVRAMRRKVAIELWSDPEIKARRVAAMKVFMNTQEAVAKRSAAIKAAWARRKAQSSI